SRYPTPAHRDVRAGRKNTDASMGSMGHYGLAGPGNTIMGLTGAVVQPDRLLRRCSTYPLGANTQRQVLHNRIVALGPRQLWRTRKPATVQRAEERGDGCDRGGTQGVTPRIRR